MCLKDILQDLRLLPSKGMTLYSDSRSAIAMANNPVQHECTKHARVARHYIKHSIDEGYIIPQYVPSSDQVADIFTQGIPGPQFQALVCKLGMINIYTQLEGVLVRCLPLHFSLFCISLSSHHVSLSPPDMYLLLLVYF